MMGPGRTAVLACAGWWSGTIPPAEDPGPVRTVGHGTLAEDELLRLLGEAGITEVVDVRSFPGSRRNPQYGREELARWLPAAGIDYSWDPRLGGRRSPRAGSPNMALRHPAFQAYADHMASPEFDAGLDALVEVARTARPTVMCAESVWWRCHRRLLADALVLLRGVGVEHVFHDGRVVAHVPTPEARVAGGHLVYDLGSTAPLL